jgi:tetratricopeptide (TPR) repeat protein
VIARTSSSQYRGTNKPARQIADELGVQYLLTGTVRWVKSAGSSRVRVSPELIDVSSGTAKWQAPFDAALTDVFQVQGEIAGRVAEALDVALGAKEERVLAERPTRSLPAYDAFLRGEDATRRLATLDPAALRRGVVYYQHAVKLDSTFALAWSRLSRAHSFLYSTSSSNPVDSASSWKAATRAMALAKTPEAHQAVGNYFLLVEFDPQKAVEEYRKGLAIAPKDAGLIGAQVVPEQAIGHLEDAAGHAREAFRLDPRSHQAAQRVARMMIMLRRFDEAIAAAETAIQLSPTSPDAVWMKVVAYVGKGDLDGAHRVYRQVSPQLDRVALVAYVAHIWEMAWTLERPDLDLLTSLTPEPFAGERTDWGLALAQAWALKGDSARSRIYADTARVAFEGMLRRSARNAEDHALLGLSLAYLRRYSEAIQAGRRAVTERERALASGGAYRLTLLARIYAMAGKRDEAISTLERLLERPSYVTPGWLRIDPTFAGLRSSPRFRRLAEMQ